MAAVAVVVPAHDEEDLLPRCLDHLAVAASEVAVPVRVLVVADSCSDSTVAVARERGVDVVETMGQNVGAARAAGCERALEHGAPGALWLACTDADTEVDHLWLATQLSLADDGADVVLGVVRLPTGTGHRRHGASYLRSVDSDGSHRHVHGANMGLRAGAYRAAGGFPHLPVGEDRALVERLERLGGLCIVRTAALSVETSPRLVGRAPGGFAADLAAVEAGA